jgi:amidophosphoribosyltransferase
MSEDIHHECGVAALYWMDRPVGKGGRVSGQVSNQDVTPLIPAMLLDIQNRGQLAAGITAYNPERAQILDTYKQVGTVSEAFRMSHPAKYSAIIKEYAGRAIIGHTRYATCGDDDTRYAQPFERHHGRLWKWFAFAFNGNLANYTQLRDQLLAKRGYHFTLDTDTEIIMHALSYRLRGDSPPDLVKVMSSLARSFDGAYNMVFQDAMGRMVIARDPLGIRPMCWAVQGKLLAAASESVALANMGFTNIKSLEPGTMILVEDGKMRVERYAKDRSKARCFFEWVYFASVGSTIDEAGVYTGRANSGRVLAAMEDQGVQRNSVVVPVPDTAKAAADAYSYAMGIPCVEGLIRNRYVGRTFINSGSTRSRAVRSKYTPLRSVLNKQRVFLIEDSIVRSTTLRALASQIRKRGGAKEIHVRVACPPIISPCFYGIDMSTLGELFAPPFCDKKYNGVPSQDSLDKMAAELGVDTLRYLPVPELGPCLGVDPDSICTGCVTGKYPTECGRQLIRQARKNFRSGRAGRTYE